MTKEEFLAIASQTWDKLDRTRKTSNNLHDYESNFDALWVNFGRDIFEGSLGKLPNDYRKKNRP